MVVYVGMHNKNEQNMNVGLNEISVCIYDVGYSLVYPF